MKCDSSYIAATKDNNYANQKRSIGVIDTQTFNALISSKVPMVILDARTAAYDDGRRIGSARSLTSDANEAQIAQMIPSKQTLVVVYCSNPQCRASTNLANRLSDLGYANILKYEEGIDGWTQAGLPVRSAR